MTTNATKLKALTENIETIIRGKPQEVKYVVTALLARGHILLEDNPGAGKTVLAKTLAQSISEGSVEFQSTNGGVAFKRIQFTPDLLPMDLIGSHIFDESKKDFVFKKGPLFTHVLLADEINRASPKVQSALLECMAENQISSGDATFQLDPFFFTIATQNPIEMEGTYPLPAAQLDRFYMKISFGYVSEEVEFDIYTNYLTIGNGKSTVKQVLTYSDIIHLQQEAENVYVHPEIIKGVVRLVQSTRHHPEIALGCSTRGGITFIKCLKAWALVNQRDYVIEDDMRALAQPVMHHRLIFRNREASRTALQQLVDAEVNKLAKLGIQGKK
ncbi:MAG: MoxR family ATPase [Cytophagales bacterium]|jgi:MoxR-like ATPase|nr:MoxR family ATPase [Cytophagales bacterium]MCA6369278.1 MoxR family ATPase [Cytophagales bacterium]MCA6371829.1 MoxR family ATPase [Cytophagales bacterium]MCA6376058.1 MoxR family ATPase [Cytophagales bacterium]MCA6384237.1 MoxR family ATPase [Cytophagales bacterium]